jgi:hypothetical protein
MTRAEAEREAGKRNRALRALYRERGWTGPLWLAQRVAPYSRTWRIVRPVPIIRGEHTWRTIRQ